MQTLEPAPELIVSAWLNTPTPIRLADLRGKVVVLHTFQMLCPGCISHGIPQAERVARTFSPAEVVVLGLHTVFEHHAVMGREALEVFIHEYRLSMPVGIDQSVEGDPIPATMRALELGGTPSLVLIDRQGQLRCRQLGQIDDMVLGARIAMLMAEPVGGASGASASDG